MLFFYSLEGGMELGSAGSGFHAGAAELPGVLEHDGIAAQLLGPRESDASGNLDHEQGSALGQRGAGTKVS